MFSKPVGTRRIRGMGKRWLAKDEQDLQILGIRRLKYGSQWRSLFEGKICIVL
jgi:hypothetical protein